MTESVQRPEPAVKILIAEDSPTQASQLRYILERRGYEVAVAANGRIALDMVREFGPGLIISDVVMPEIDGYQLCNAVKNDLGLRDLPVILVTTMSDPLDVIRGLECGADNFVVKPYDEQYLLSRVQHLFVNRQMRGPHDAGMGVEIYFNRERHFITADRLQILNLLLSTYDAAIQRNEEVNRNREELKNANTKLNEMTLELEQRVRDRTEELERSNTAVRESETRLRLTIETALDAVVTLDAQGTIRDWNAQAELIFGRTREEAVGQQLHELIIPARYRAQHVRGMKRYLKTGEGPVLNRRIEVSALRRDGTEFPVELAISPIIYRGKRMFSGFVRDISQRVENETRIRQLSRINEMILNYAAEGIIAIGRAGELLFANPAAQRLLGWSSEEVVTDVHAALHRGEEHPEGCPLLADLRGGGSRSSETTFEGAGGKQLEVRYTAAVIVQEDEVTGWVLTFADITERKRLEQKLEQANRVSSLGRVAATIAHEFNNVLMGIQPFAEVIQRRSGDENIVKAASQIFSSVTRGKRVTQDILRFTQPAAPSLTQVVVGDWLANLLPELRGLVGPHIAVTIDVPKRPIRIEADPTQLQQVVTNLVLNARDAIAGQGSITLAVSEDAPREWVSISVTDTGSGMSEEVLRNIFDPLYTTKRTGTGLGLAVAVQVIDHHRGSIHVRSTLGKGSTFIIELPVMPGGESFEGEGDRANQPVLRKILLVEDDLAVATGISLLLETEGMLVRAVDRGAEALRAIDDFAPDVVVLDLSLPDVDGATVYRQIAETHPTLPVIFSSGHGQDSLADSTGVGHVAFLRKPYDLEQLLTTLQELTGESVSR